MNKFLELNDVSKAYGQGSSHTWVLRNINLQVAEGEFVAIIGFSGAGKTTLISMIAGLIPPDQGTIRLREKPVTRPGPDRGVVFQNYSLLPWLTAYQNVFLAVEHVFPQWSAAKKRERTEHYLDLVNLGSAHRKRPSELSGGMRQRVALARALAIDPEVLLLDEPLSALDALTRVSLQDEIERIWERDQKTVILITNDIDEAILLADRVIPLSAGPNATLGPEFSIGIGRPRDRKMLKRDVRFKKMKNQLIEYLICSQGQREPNAAGVQIETPVYGVEVVA